MANIIDEIELFISQFGMTGDYKKLNGFSASDDLYEHDLLSAAKICPERRLCDISRNPDGTIELSIPELSPEEAVKFAKFLKIEPSTVQYNADIFHATHTFLVSEEYLQQTLPNFKVRILAKLATQPEALKPYLHEGLLNTILIKIINDLKSSLVNTEVSVLLDDIQKTVLKHTLPSGTKPPINTSDLLGEYLAVLNEISSDNLQLQNIGGLDSLKLLLNLFRIAITPTEVLVKKVEHEKKLSDFTALTLFKGVKKGALGVSRSAANLLSDAIKSISEVTKRGP